MIKKILVIMPGVQYVEDCCNVAKFYDNAKQMLKQLKEMNLEIYCVAEDEVASNAFYDDTVIHWISCLQPEDVVRVKNRDASYFGMRYFDLQTTTDVPADVFTRAASRYKLPMLPINEATGRRIKLSELPDYKRMNYEMEILTKIESRVKYVLKHFYLDKFNYIIHFDNTDSLLPTYTIDIDSPKLSCNFTAAHFEPTCFYGQMPVSYEEFKQILEV